MCGFNCGYHDLNICYYERPMVNFNKTQTVRIITFHHNKDLKFIVIVIDMDWYEIF